MRAAHRKIRNVIVTGGSAGVGRAVVQRFAAAGDRVGVIARDPAALEDMRRELCSRGAPVEVEAVDVSDAEAVLAAAVRLERKLGTLDVWINSAAVGLLRRKACAAWIYRLTAHRAAA